MVQPVPLTTIAKRGLLVLVIGLVANWLLLGIADASNLVEPFGALSFPPVTFLTILGATAATAVYGAITRISPEPDWLFLRVAVVALVLSFAPDIAVLRFDPTATLGAVIVLMLMHVTVAVASVLLLTERYSFHALRFR